MVLLVMHVSHALLVTRLKAKAPVGVQSAYLLECVIHWPGANSKGLRPADFVSSTR
jgi:hypothetical protein